MAPCGDLSATLRFVERRIRDFRMFALTFLRACVGLCAFRRLRPVRPRACGRFCALRLPCAPCGRNENSRSLRDDNQDGMTTKVGMTTKTG